MRSYEVTLVRTVEQRASVTVKADNRQNAVYQATRNSEQQWEEVSDTIRIASVAPAAAE